MIEVNLLEPKSGQHHIGDNLRLVVIPPSWEPTRRPMVMLSVRQGLAGQPYYSAKRVRTEIMFREN
jgi:hypothetical protein